MKSPEFLIVLSDDIKAVKGLTLSKIRDKLDERIKELFNIDLHSLTPAIAQQPYLHASLGKNYAELKRRHTVDLLQRKSDVFGIKQDVSALEGLLYTKFRGMTNDVGKKKFTEKEIENLVNSDEKLNELKLELNGRQTLEEMDTAEVQFQLDYLNKLMEASSQRAVLLSTLGGLCREERKGL